jgi:hypothetical protein
MVASRFYESLLLLLSKILARILCIYFIKINNYNVRWTESRGEPLDCHPTVEEATIREHECIWPALLAEWKQRHTVGYVSFVMKEGRYQKGVKGRGLCNGDFIEKC